MKRVCAKCNTGFGETVPIEDTRETHLICGKCSRVLYPELPESVHCEIDRHCEAGRVITTVPDSRVWEEPK